MERLMLGFITVMNTKKKNAAISGNNVGKVMNIIQIKSRNEDGQKIYLCGKVQEERNARRPLPEACEGIEREKFCSSWRDCDVWATVTQRLHGLKDPGGAGSCLREVTLFTTVLRDIKKDVLRKYPRRKVESLRIGHNG